MHTAPCFLQTLGNHEFDFGPQKLGSFISNLTFPMLGACNIDTTGEPALRDKLKQYTVLQYQKYKVSLYCPAMLQND
jgi:5'-nucleotidase